MTSPAIPVTDHLAEAFRRLVRTVDALPDEAWAGPSLLPGWTRGHVVAHLALNAEGLAGALVGVAEGEAVPMYASDQQRDDDIDALAAAGPAELRDRLFAGATRFTDALALMVAHAAETPGLGETLIDRTPAGTRRFPAHQVAWMRLREVEIHHADLGLDYSPADWPHDFAMALVSDAVQRQPDTLRATLVATDVEGTWLVGDGTTAGPTVVGPVAGLAWWLTGRPPHRAAEVTSDDGELPGIGAW